MHQNSVDYIAHFITFLKHEKRFSANTVIAYEGDVQEFRIFLLGLFGELDIKEIKYQHIRTWLASLKEMNDQSVAIRRHGKGDQGSKNVDDFITGVLDEINERRDHVD